MQSANIVWIYAQDLGGYEAASRVESAMATIMEGFEELEKCAKNKPEVTEIIKTLMAMTSKKAIQSIHNINSEVR